MAVMRWLTMLIVVGLSGCTIGPINLITVTTPSSPTPAVTPVVKNTSPPVKRRAVIKQRATPKLPAPKQATVTVRPVVPDPSSGTFETSESKPTQPTASVEGRTEHPHPSAYQAVVMPPLPKFTPEESQNPGIVQERLVQYIENLRKRIADHNSQWKHTPIKPDVPAPSSSNPQQAE